MADQVKSASADEARDVAEAARETEWSHPSFVRELFLGRFRADLIHPHHLEFGTTAAPLQLGATGVETGRSFFVAARWQF